MYEVMADVETVTLTEFAERIGVDRTTVENWRRNRIVGPPFPEPAKKRARLHEWSTEDLARWMLATKFADLVPAEWKPKGRKR